MSHVVRKIERKMPQFFAVVFFSFPLLLSSAGTCKPPSRGTEGRKEKIEKRQRATHQNVMAKERGVLEPI
jgi:hypothetical protein